MRTSSRLCLASLGAGALAGLSALLACGPFIPGDYLGNSSLVALRAPVADPFIELKKLAQWSREAFPDPDLTPLPLPAAEQGRHQRFKTWKDSFQTTIEIETGELKDILTAQDMQRWSEARWELQPHVGPALAGDMADLATKAPQRLAAIKAISFPKAPEGFRLYVEGVRAFAAGDAAEARKLWAQVRQLPPDQQRPRAVWAAYMTARSHEVEEQWALAREGYRQTRRLAREGASDPLGLSIASFRREADCATAAGDEETAARLRLAWLACGDEEAVQVIRRNMESVPLDDEAALNKAATQPVRRLLLSLTLLDTSFEDQLSLSGGKDANAPWLEALEKHLHEAPLLHSERLAWAAYSKGDFDRARRWLKFADAKEPMTQWLQGKFALMEGRKKEASRSFAAAQSAYPPRADALHVWWDTADGGVYYNAPAPEGTYMQPCQFHADSAIARLANGEFIAAMEGFMASGSWRDAAYIAERVLSREELLIYVRRHTRDEDYQKNAPPSEAILRAGYPAESSSSRPSLKHELRYLAARRLARERFFKDALPLFPAQLREPFGEYVKHWRAGHDASLSPAKRSEELWEAAKLHRKHGMEFFGYANDPDHQEVEGEFQLGFTAQSRMRGKLVSRDDQGELVELPSYWYDANTWQSRRTEVMSSKLPDPALVFPRPTAEEAWRLKQYGQAPAERRFHYRYVAAELGWQAALLLPDNDEKTAEILRVSGLWLAGRDPKAADRFYQALVSRNAALPIGQEAEKKRWFPRR